MSVERKADLEAKLAASVDPNSGKAKPGYRRRVAAINDEISRIDASMKLGVDKPAPAVGQSDHPLAGEYGDHL